MFCSNCGSHVDDKTVVCPHCGMQIGELHISPAPQPAKTQDTTNTVAIVGLVLAFFVPLAGLICSAVGFSRATKNGRDYKWLALAGILISIVMMIVGYIVQSLFLKRFFEEFTLWYQ